MNTDFECEACGSQKFQAMGSLGSRFYVRCRACGMDHFLHDDYDEVVDYYEVDENGRQGINSI